MNHDTHAPTQAQIEARKRRQERREAKKKEALDPAVIECRKRVGITGQTFPESTPAEWVYREPVWYHTSEEDHFSIHYSCSIKSGRWFKNSELVTCEVVKYGGHTIGVASPSELEKPTPCEDSGTMCEEAHMKVVYRKAGAPRRVCIDRFNSSYRKCDHSGEYWWKESMAKIHEKNAKHGKLTFIATTYLKVAGYVKCSNCGAYCFHEYIVPNSMTNQPICVVCQNSTAAVPFSGTQHILAHDAKDYPAKIYKKKTRMGHKVGDDGLIYATNKPAEVQDVRLWGVEVETEMNKSMMMKEQVHRQTLAGEIKKTLGTDFCITKEDGTLTMNGKYSDPGSGGHIYAGFEIVSAPASFDVHVERWTKLLDAPHFKMFRAWDTETCGFHVHVNRDSLSPLQIGRMLVFINHLGNKKFIEKVAGRSEKKFTRYVPKEPSDAIHPERVISPDEEKDRDRRRRVALNVSNPYTVEFRIFRGTINPKHIIRNMEFCDAVCDFCLPCARSLKDFSDPAQFIKFVDANRKRWPRFAAWLAHWGYIKSAKVTDKTNKELLTLKSDHLVEEDDKTDNPDPSPITIKMDFDETKLPAKKKALAFV